MRKDMELVEGQLSQRHTGLLTLRGLVRGRLRCTKGSRPGGQHQLVSHFIEHAQESHRALNMEVKRSHRHLMSLAVRLTEGRGGAETVEIIRCHKEDSSP